MRIDLIGYLLSFGIYCHGVAYASPLARGERSEEAIDSVDSSANSTDPIPVPQEMRIIDFKITEGGLKLARDIIQTSMTSTGAIAGVVAVVMTRSSQNSCMPYTGSGQSDDGKQKFNFKYWVTSTGNKCDTTARTKTVAAAIDNAWDEVHRHNYNYACISMSHGGTWHGHLVVATVGSGVDVNDVKCD